MAPVRCGDGSLLIIPNAILPPTRNLLWHRDEFSAVHPFWVSGTSHHQERLIMRIVVIGGTGLIGSKLVHTLTEHGHDAVAAAPSTGVNTLTGEGLPEVLAGASVVVDVSNSPDARRRGDRVLPHGDHEPAHGREGCRGWSPCRAVGGGHRSTWPRRAGTSRRSSSGEAHQRRSHSLLHRARDAVLRVRQDPRRLRDRSTTRCACHPLISSRWRLPTSRKGSLSRQSVTRSTASPRSVGQRRFASRPHPDRTDRPRRYPRGRRRSRRTVLGHRARRAHPRSR